MQALTTGPVRPCLEGSAKCDSTNTTVMVQITLLLTASGITHSAGMNTGARAKKNGRSVALLFKAHLTTLTSGLVSPCASAFSSLSRRHGPYKANRS